MDAATDGEKTTMTTTIDSITTATVPAMSDDMIRQSLEMHMGDEDASVETVTALRVRFMDRLNSVRADRAAGMHAAFGASMESGAAGLVALADEYLVRATR